MGRPGPGGMTGEAKAGLGLRRAHGAGGRLAVVHRAGNAGRRHAVGAHVGHATRRDGALRELRLEAHAAVLLALRKSDIQRLGASHLAVHLGHRAGRLVGGGEGDEGGAAAARKEREGGGRGRVSGGGGLDFLA